jgi:hypothetical protein
MPWVMAALAECCTLLALMEGQSAGLIRGDAGAGSGGAVSTLAPMHVL